MPRKIFVIVILLLTFISLPVSAHEERTVGAYDLELGWRVEPVYVGVYNGPEFFVHDASTGDSITGLESTLHLLVHFGDQEKLLPFYEVEGDPGHYTADLIPTRPGDYTFHLFGTVNDQDVDEQFTSADGYFGTVDPATDILFPPLDTADAASVQAQIDDLRAQLAQLTGTETP